MAIGLILMLTIPVLVIAIVLYAAGYGIMWIARGTLPLALFGPERYPLLMGRLAFPSLISQALAPWLGAMLIERSGTIPTMATLGAFAVVNVLLIGFLWSAVRRR
jgi:hypothetical protein